MLIVSRFIYDLAGLPKPTEEELNDEIDRLLYMTTAEQPNYIADPDTLDPIVKLDSEILVAWLNKKFKPVLLMLILERQDNYQKSKEELCKMSRYDTLVNKFIRPGFLKRHAMKQIRDFYFANNDRPSIKHAVLDLKRLLTRLSEHLDKQESITLLNTDRYTNADIQLYNYLKRIVLGEYRNDSLTSHVRLCDPLVKFMRRYANKNPEIIDISSEDPLARKNQEPSLLTDIVKSATVGLGFILFFLFIRKK